MKTIRTLLIALLATALAPSASADDHGGTLATATTISNPDTPGNLETTTDRDWFKLVVTIPGRHWIYTTGSNHTYANLFNGAGVQITLAPNLTGVRREATVMIGGIPNTILQNPAASTEGTIPQPSLAIFPAVILAIETVIGAHYRIETSNDLIHWQDTSVEFIGNGAEMSSAVERTQAKAYFRAAVN